jgi:hypothetical protein
LDDVRFDDLVLDSRLGLAAKIKAKKGDLAYERFVDQLQSGKRFYHDPMCRCGRNNINPFEDE